MITKSKIKQIKAAKRANARRAIKLLQPVPAILRAEARAEKWNMPDPSLYANQIELLRRVPSVQTAVDMICRVTSISDLRVVSLAGEEKKSIVNHDLELLMKAPNVLNSAVEFLTETTTHRLLAGNCYWWLNKTSEKAVPDSIWVIPPQDIIPVPDENLYLKGYAYDPGDGQIIPLETWEIVHFKRPNPFNSFVGLSLVEALAVTALGDMEGRKWLTRFYAENDGAPSAIFAFSDMINDIDWVRLQRSFKDASKKKKAVMLRGVGKGGVDWMKAGSTPKEAQFLEGLTANKETIYDAIAPGLSSMLAVNSNEANARVGEAIFKNYAVWGLLSEYASKINQKGGLLSLYGDKLFAEYDDIRISDRALELQELAAYKETHRVDEVRKKYWQDEAVGDERGDLFVAQISQTSGAEKEEVKEEITATPSNASIEESNPEEIVEEPVKSALEIDLDKWKRKSVKRFPDIAPFESKVIPHAIKADILKQLESCQDVGGVRTVFNNALDVQPDTGSEIEGLAKMLDVAIKSLADEKEPERSPTIVNLTIPAKADMTPQEMADAFALALGNVPAPQVNIVNEVKPTPVDVAVEAGDVIIPAQEPPVVNVDVNLKQVEKMTTLHKRNKGGEVYRSDTEIE